MKKFDLYNILRNIPENTDDFQNILKILKKKVQTLRSIRHKLTMSDRLQISCSTFLLV